MKNFITIAVFSIVFFTLITLMSSLGNAIANLLPISGTLLVISKVGITLLLSIALGAVSFLISYYTAMLVRNLLTNI